MTNTTNTKDMPRPLHRIVSHNGLPATQIQNTVTQTNFHFYHWKETKKKNGNYNEMAPSFHKWS